MATPDLEDVIEQVKEIFQSQFPDQLSTVDAQKASPLSPNPPLAYYFGDIRNLPQLPAMLFTGHETSENQDEYEWRNQTYHLEIEAYYQHQDVQTLSRIVRRYGTAIDEVLRANQRLNGLSQNITSISQKYWDSMSAKTGLLQVVNVSFEVTVITS